MPNINTLQTLCTILVYRRKLISFVSKIKGKNVPMSTPKHTESPKTINIKLQSFITECGVANSSVIWPIKSDRNCQRISKHSNHCCKILWMTFRLTVGQVSGHFSTRQSQTGDLRLQQIRLSTEIQRNRRTLSRD